MQPINTRTLLIHLFRQMERLDKGEITNETACAQAKLASQANNVLNYELKRTIVQIKMLELGVDYDTTKVELREIETDITDNQ